jgi:hypothetical protein
MLPHGGEVVSEKDGVEDLDQQEYRSLGKTLQGSVRQAVRAGSLADLETPDGVMNFIRVG